MTTEATPLSELARTTRDSLGLTQQEMAQRLGVPLRTYVGWELAETTPHREHAVRRDILEIGRATSEAS